MKERFRRNPLFAWRKAITDSNLPPTARLVALTLSIHMDNNGSSCFPSVGRLKGETGQARRTVQRALRQLEEAGWIVSDGVQVVRTATRGEQFVPRYRAVLPPRRGATVTPRQQERGRQHDTPSTGRHSDTGRHQCTDGASPVHRRGVTVTPEVGREDAIEGDTLLLLPTDTVVSTGRRNGRRSKPAKSNAPHAGREWARPYYEPWMERCGGDPDVGLLRKKVEPLERRDGRDVTIRRWQNFLPGLNPRFFASKGDPFKNAVVRFAGAPKLYDDTDWYLSDP